MDKNIANTVLKRANGFCEHCGRSGDLTLHHRKLKSRGGKDSVSNLIAVLHECHLYDIHANPKRAEEMGWMIPSWGNAEEYPLRTPEGNTVRLNPEGSYENI
jgi:5-methylcytosine-specific restriction endonuclease McrA